MRLAALGKRDRELGTTDMTELEQRLARRQAMGIAIKSTVVTIAVTAAIYLLPPF